MEKGIFLSKNASQTQKLAGKIAVDLMTTKGSKNARVLALEGELGGGKTTFVQGLAKAMGIKGRVTSPSFVIMRRFKLSNCSIDQLNNFYHIDCYRVDNPKEILALDFKKIIADPKNIVAIEWAEKVKSLIPKKATWLKFNWLSENKRRIAISKNA